MKPRKDEILTCVLFCGFLAVMMVCFLLMPKQDFSETEKRYLEDPPVVTWENLASGKLGNDIETYMADHIPGRNFFVGLNAYYDLFSGRQNTKDVRLLEDDRLVEAPTQWNAAAAARNMSCINAFAQTIGQQVDLMIVPSAGWAAEEGYQDEQIISDIYAMAEAPVATVDLNEILAGREEYFYKTDHHWTSRGAYTAYRAYMEQLGREYRDESDFEIRTAEGFHGSTYSRSALWLLPAEPLEMWYGSEDLLVTNGETESVHDGVFYTERLSEADMYTVYLDGNHSIVRIENPAMAGKGKLLVIRDSYSNSLGTFLAESYETVVLVDLRYYKSPISELCAQEGFDDVLVCYSIGNFMTDTNIIWLQ